MAKKKYYAVRSGRTPGVYLTWEDAKAQVDGYPGAEYKSFKELEEAASFLEEEQLETKPAEKAEPKHVLPEMEVPADTAYAFVDGSFNPDTNVYGFGGFLRLPEADGKREEVMLQGFGNNAEMASMRNVAGEIEGSRTAIARAWEAGCRKVQLFYDYHGIEAWANGTWKANKSGTQMYQSYVNLMRSKGMEISFEHVKAHTGIEGNELADRLAKQAVGIDVDVKLPFDGKFAADETWLENQWEMEK